MKKLIIIIAVLLLAAPLFAAENAVVKEVSGRVQVQVQGGTWQDVSAGDEMPKGASISTGFGSSAVLEVGASELTVEAMTRMKLEELIQTQSTQTTGLYLRVGKVKANVKRDTGLSHDFQLRSPSSTAAVRGTEFTFDGKTVEVDRGAVAIIANNIAREMIVATGEKSTVSSTGKASNPVAEKVKESTTVASTVKTENTSAQSEASTTSSAAAPPASSGSSPVKLYGDITITVQ